MRNESVGSPTKRKVAALFAGALLLAVSLISISSFSGAATAGTPTNFSSGSLIIPMDTDTSGNHASYNQNLGMWKAYGLVYRLLQNGVPVSWAIRQNKTSASEIDFTVSSVKDLRTNTALSSWDYRGGAFVVDSAQVAKAQPIKMSLRSSRIRPRPGSDCESTSTAAPCVPARWLPSG